MKSLQSLGSAEGGFTAVAFRLQRGTSGCSPVQTHTQLDPLKRRRFVREAQ